MQRVIAVVVMGAVLSLAPISVYADVSLAQRFTQLEKEFGIPDGILGRVAKAETGTCNAQVRAGGGSTATGLFQWLEGSWKTTAPRVNPKYGNTNLRLDPFISAHVTAYALKNIQNANGSLIQQAKIDTTLGIYMGHFLGQGGSRAFLNAYIRDPNANGAALFPKQARANPGVFRNGSLRNILQHFANKLSSSCTSATGYTSTLNNGPIGSDVADRAVAASAPVPVTSAIYKDPERDYVDVYPPPYQAGSGAASPTSVDTPTQYPGLTSQPTPLSPQPIVPTIPTPAPFSFPTSSPSTINTGDIFTPNTNTNTNTNTGTSNENSTEETGGVTVSIFDRLNDIAFGTTTTVGTGAGSTTVTITPIITSSAFQLTPTNVTPSDVSTPIDYTGIQTTFGSNNTSGSVNTTQYSILQTFAAILQDTQTLLERINAFVRGENI